MDNRKKELINRYLSGDATPQEFWEVERLLSEDEEFLRRFEITKGLGKMQQTAFEKQAIKEIEAYQFEPVLAKADAKTIFWTFPKIATGIAASIIFAFIIYGLMNHRTNENELLTTLSAVEKVDVINDDGKGFSSTDTSNHVTGSVVVQLFRSDSIEANITKYIYIRDFETPEADTLKVYFAEATKQAEWKNAKELIIKYNEKEDLYNLLIDNKKKFGLKTNTLDVLK